MRPPLILTDITPYLREMHHALFVEGLLSEANQQRGPGVEVSAAASLTYPLVVVHDTTY